MLTKKRKARAACLSKATGGGLYRCKYLFKCVIVVAVMILGPAICFANVEKDSLIDKKLIASIQQELILKFGKAEKERIIKGTEQLAAAWLPSDGDAAVFKKFCSDNFLSPSDLQPNFTRISRDIVALRGNISEARDLITEPGKFTDVAELQADSFFRKSLPDIDPYKTKLAQFIKLNFPYYSLSEKRKYGAEWPAEKWAMVRLGDIYAARKIKSKRSPFADEERAFKRYMEHYFIRMQDICMPDGSYPFSSPVVLHSHRGLRDEVKDEYTSADGKIKQALIGKVIEHIVLGTIPKEFREDTTTRWNPWTNKLFRVISGKEKEVKFTMEDAARYEGLLAIFKNRKNDDTYLANGTNYIQRNFEGNSLTMEETETLIRKFLEHPVFNEAGALIQKILKRPLEPFDIWYSGFQDQSAFRSSMLDSVVQARYPDAAAFQKDLPAILKNIGFPENEAVRLGSRIRIRPVTSGGYTMRPSLPDGKATLTTMFATNGMDYKSYRVAIHELGHAVEMLYTADGVSNFLLADVPSNGITEGVAELFAYRNINGLGLDIDEEKQRHMQALATLWYLYEMGGQALTEIETWKWMYAHPDASAGDLRTAVLKISETIWNTYYAPVFKIKDQHLLSIYNHFITGELYLYNYFYSNVIMFQLYDSFGNAGMPEKLKTACKEGNTLPGLWMQHAVGSGISTDSLLQASEKAVDFFSREEVNKANKHVK